MVMKKLVTLGLIVSSTLFYKASMPSTSISAKEFNNELSGFIDTLMHDHSKYTFSYLVFVAKFYSDSGSCFTLDYILNSWDYSYVNPTYVYSYQNNLIVIKFDKESNYVKLINRLGFKKIDEKSKDVIIKKLFPAEDGGFTYRSRALTYCNNHGKITKLFYNNADMIPPDRSIYDNFSPPPYGHKVSWDSIK